jgi:hypothetical protein
VLSRRAISRGPHRDKAQALPVLPIRNTHVTALCDDVYAEDDLAPAERDALREAWVTAARNLNVAFETVRSSPVVSSAVAQRARLRSAPGRRLPRRTTSGSLALR